MIYGPAQATKLFPEVEVGKRQLSTDLLSHASKQKNEERSNPERTLQLICLERDFMPLFLLSEHCQIRRWRVMRRRRTGVLDN